MSCGIWQVVEETIKDVLDDPTLGDEIIEELYEYDNELAEDRKIFLDIDKAWDGIQFLLGKSRLGIQEKLFTTGGKEIPGIDLGYGPARYFNPLEVAKLSKDLQKTKFEDLRKGLQVSDLVAAEVYPYSADETADDAFGYMEGHWDSFVQIMNSAVDQKRGLLIYLF